MARSIPEAVLTELVTAVRPLVDAVEENPDGSGIVRLALEVGLDINGRLSQQQIQDFTNLVRTTYTALRIAIDNPQGLVSELPQIVQNSKRFVEIVEDLDNILPPGEDLGTRIFNLLVVSYLENRVPIVLTILVLLGIVRRESIPANPPLPAYNRREVLWQYFPDLVRPDRALERVYGWGSSNLDSNLLLAHLSDLLWDVGFPAIYEGTRSPGTDGTMSLLWGVGLGPISVPFSFTADYLPTDGSDPPGLSVAPFGSIAFTTELDITETIKLVVNSVVSASSGYAIRMRPNKVIISALPSEPAVDWTLRGEIKIVAEAETGKPLILFGSADGSRLQANSTSLAASVLAAVDRGEVGIEFNVLGAKLVIALGGADGFLTSVIPETELSLDFEFTIGVASSIGLYFRGSGALEIALPLHLKLGPLHIETVNLRLMAGEAENIEVELSATFGLELGPLQASVKGVGASADFDFSQGSRSALDVTVDFKPPTGAGLSIDAGITGGGFLEFDSDNERYAGILALSFGEIAITAIGLITTKLPGGKKGFSMLVNIGVTFSPPITLPYNFTLSGVGGLIGVNRSMSVDALRDGLLNHTLDSILIPDPATFVENADDIISNMRTVFPVAEGRYVVAPLLKIGWGQNNIIAADIGIFIELPAPVQLAILGQISARFPDPDNADVVLNIDVLGEWDVAQKKIKINSTIYNSRIYTYPLSGDAALLLSYGNNPNFVMSVGGFHPRFIAPSEIRSLRMLSLCIRRGENFIVTLSGYMALTPNTLQFGARADLYAKYSGAICTGMLSFDALIYFSPFTFETNISGSVVIRYRGKRLAGVYLRLDFKGPRPWIVNGEITVEIFWWDVTVKINKTWGDRGALTSPAVNPLPKLKAALSDRSAWGAQLPVNMNTYEMLADLEQSDASSLIVHPAGVLEIRQSVLPLDVQLQRLGNSPVKAYSYFDIKTVTLNNASLTLESLQEDFAPGQFKTLSDPLTAPSFEKMKSGVTVAADQAQFAANKITVVEHKYESRIIADDRTSIKSLSPEPAKMAWTNGVLQMGRSVQRKRLAAVSVEDLFKSRSKLSRVTKQQETYSVVNKSDLSIVETNVDNPDDPINALDKIALNGSLGYTSASELMKACVLAKPSLAGKLDIVESYEVA